MTYAAALGGFSKGMTPLELAGAYSGFIDGTYTPVHAIRSVKDKEGNVLYEWPNDKIDVWSPDYGFQDAELAIRCRFKWDWTRYPLYNKRIQEQKPAPQTIIKIYGLAD